MLSLVNDFIEYLRNERKLSENTSDSYRLDLLQLIKFIKSKGLSLTVFGKLDARAYIMHLEQSSASRKSIARKIPDILQIPYAGRQNKIKSMEDRINTKDLKKASLFPVHGRDVGPFGLDRSAYSGRIA